MMIKEHRTANTLAYNSYRAFKNATSSLASAVSSGDKKSHEFGNSCIQQLVSHNFKTEKMNNELRKVWIRTSWKEKFEENFTKLQKINDKVKFWLIQIRE